MSIEGTWYNELGSKMVIDHVSSDGSFSGYYETAVSSSGCAKGKFPLSGRYYSSNDGDIVGFVVSWENSQSACNSVTSWSGQVYEDQIVTFWLLHMGTTEENEWESTLLGQDIFYGFLLPKEDIAKKSKSVRRSHP